MESFTPDSSFSYQTCTNQAVPYPYFRSLGTQEIQSIKLGLCCKGVLSTHSTDRPALINRVLKLCKVGKGLRHQQLRSSWWVGRKSAEMGLKAKLLGCLRDVWGWSIRVQLALLAATAGQSWMERGCYLAGLRWEMAPRSLAVGSLLVQVKQQVRGSSWQDEGGKADACYYATPVFDF